MIRIFKTGRNTEKLCFRRTSLKYPQVKKVAAGIRF
jgi:hypothetical protein